MNIRRNTHLFTYFGVRSLISLSPLSTVQGKQFTNDQDKRRTEVIFFILSCNNVYLHSYHLYGFKFRKMKYFARDERLRTLIENVPSSDYSLFFNNKKIKSESDLASLGINALITVNFKLIGGKGGFGSLLRAIGSQIKTTDKQSCR